MGYPWKQPRQQLRRGTKVADKYKDHHIGRIVGVFPRQVLGEDALKALAWEPNQIEILGVGFDSRRWDSRKGCEQLLINDPKAGR